MAELIKASGWANLISTETPHGSIRVIKDVQRQSQRKNSNRGFKIELTTSSNTILNLDTRKSYAYILKQLLDNFGEFTTLMQFELPYSPYNTNSSLPQKISLLRNLIGSTEYTIIKDPFSNKYKIDYKKEAIEQIDNQQGEM